MLALFLDAYLKFEILELQLKYTLSSTNTCLCEKESIPESCFKSCCFLQYCKLSTFLDLRLRVSEIRQVYQAQRCFSSCCFLQYHQLLTFFRPEITCLWDNTGISQAQRCFISCLFWQYYQLLTFFRPEISEILFACHISMTHISGPKRWLDY
jgi:hypothetical protein